MQNTEIERHEDRIPLKSTAEVEKALKEIEQNEQLYSIALFDILGFSNFVENNGTQVILNLYNRLLDLIDQQKSTTDGKASIAGSVVPVPTSQDWKHNSLIADANGFVRVCHFSDTFIIYVNYQLGKQGWWLRDTKYEPNPLLIGEAGTPYCPIFLQSHTIYLSYLQTCMEFFCQAILAGIPLRGCLSTGMALMDQDKSIYFGNPLVEAARGETAQDAMGIAFGRSFNNYHPVYHDYFIPYLGHMKADANKTKFLSPMVLDWPRFWRHSPAYKEHSLVDCIKKMDTQNGFSKYYDNAIRFVEFSEKHENWSDEINREAMGDILDFYKRAIDWYQSVK